MLDLLITHATLPDGRRDMSVAVQGERIVQVRPAWQAPAHSTVDAGGLLLSPPFVDATFTSTPPSPTASRAPTPAARCSKALPCGAS